MWIKQISLNNFQSHSATTIDFANGFNCIVGSSRSGKSSIVRALNFMFFDDWSGTFVRNGTPHTSVTVTLDNGTVVKRTKGTTLNKIDVTYPDGKVQTFEKFGITAPPEVKRILGVHSVSIDTDYTVDINLADQDSPLFLLPDSAPTKTKFMNRLTGLHVVDSAIRTARNERTYNANVKKTCEESVTRLLENLTKYDRLDTIKHDINFIYEKMENVNQNIERYDKLTATAKRVRDIDKKLKKVTRFMTTYNKIRPIVDDVETKSESAKKLFKLGHIIDRIGIIHTTIQDLNKKQAALKDEYKVCPVCLKGW